MELKLAQKIIEFCYDIGYCGDYELEIRENYIGRGRTKPTVGIVGLSALQIAQIVIENANEFVDDEYDSLFYDVGELAQDNMGLTYIVY